MDRANCRQTCPATQDRHRGNHRATARWPTCRRAPGSRQPQWQRPHSSSGHRLRVATAYVFSRIFLAASGQEFRPNRAVLPIRGSVGLSSSRDPTSGNRERALGLAKALDPTLYQNNDYPKNSWPGSASPRLESWAAYSRDSLIGTREQVTGNWHVLPLPKFNPPLRIPSPDGSFPLIRCPVRTLKPEGTHMKTGGNTHALECDFGVATRKRSSSNAE